MKRLYVDMDGTLAEFKPVDTLETLYEEGYFRNLSPHRTVIEAVKKIIEKHPDIEVNILSSVLTDSKFALAEKNAWLDQYLPEVDMQHRIFPPCGEDKKDYIKGGVTPDDYLLDDYSVNLHSWEPPAKGIKLLNGINATKGSWTSDRIRYDKPPEELAENIVNVMNDREHYQDDVPQTSNLLVEEENEVIKAFNDIVVDAENYIVQQNSEWGAWWGRIASDTHPLNYIDMEITGYSTHHEISTDVTIVRENEIIDRKSVSIKTDQNALHESMVEFSEKMKREFETYLKGGVQGIGTEFKGPLTLYSPLTGIDLSEHEKKMEASFLKNMQDEGKGVDYTKLGYMPDTHQFASEFLKNTGLQKVSSEARVFLETCALHHMGERTIREFGEEILKNNGAVPENLVLKKIDELKSVSLEMEKLERVIEADITAAGFRPSAAIISEMKQLDLMTQRTNTMADVAKLSKMSKSEVIRMCSGKEHAANIVQSLAENFRKQELDMNREQLTAKPPKIKLNLQEEIEI